MRRLSTAWWRGGSCCGPASRATWSIGCSGPAGSSSFTAGCTPWATDRSDLAAGTMAVALLADGPGRPAAARRACGRSRAAHGTGPVHAIGAKTRKGRGFVIHRTRDLRPEDVTVPLGHPRHHAPAHAPRSLPHALPRCPGRRARRGAGPQARPARGPARPAPPARSDSCWTRRPPRDRRSSATSDACSASTACRNPSRNGIVCGYEVDLHWPELKLVAELDGYAFHGHRRAFETDRERDLVLQAAGHRVVRRHRPPAEPRRTPPERFSAAAARAASSRARAGRSSPSTTDTRSSPGRSDGAGERSSRETSGEPPSRDSALYMPAFAPLAHASRDAMCTITPAPAPARP